MTPVAGKSFRNIHNEILSGIDFCYVMTFLLCNAVGPSITQTKKPLHVQILNGINLICVIDYITQIKIVWGIILL